MLYTLVIDIGTFPYTLSAVSTPWSLDQDTYIHIYIHILLNEVSIYSIGEGDHVTLMSFIILYFLYNIYLSVTYMYPIREYYYSYTYLMFEYTYIY